MAIHTCRSFWGSSSPGLPPLPLMKDIHEGNTVAHHNKSKIKTINHCKNSILSSMLTYFLWLSEIVTPLSDTLKCTTTLLGFSLEFMILVVASPTALGPVNDSISTVPRNWTLQATDKNIIKYAVLWDCIVKKKCPLWLQTAWTKLPIVKYLLFEKRLPCHRH